jgi:hypothetical protein
MGCCCFCGKDVLQVASTISFPSINNDSIKNITTVAFNAQKANGNILNEIDESTRSGEFTSINRFFYNGEKEIWQNGIAEVSYIKRDIVDFIQPIEFFNDFNPIFGTYRYSYVDDEGNILEENRDKLGNIVFIENIIIGEPQLEEVIYNRLNGLNIPANQSQYIHNIDMNQVAPNGIFEQDNESIVYIENDQDEIVIHKEKVTVNETSSLWILNNAFGILKPTQEYIIIFYTERGVKKTVILDWNEEQYPYLVPYKREELLETDLYSYPIIPIYDNNDFLTLSRDPNWKTDLGSSIINDEDDRDFVRNNFTEEEIKEDDLRKTMLKLLSIDENDLVNNYMSSMKYQEIVIKDENRQHVENILARYNQDKLASDPHWVDLSYSDLINKITIHREVSFKKDKPKYLELHRKEKEDYDEIEYIHNNYVENNYVGIENDYGDMENNHVMIEKRLLEYVEEFEFDNDTINNTHSIHISLGVLFGSDNQLMLDAVFRTLKTMKNVFDQADPREKNQFRYIEGIYNKGIEFSKIEYKEREIQNLFSEILHEDEENRGFDPQREIITTKNRYFRYGWIKGKMGQIESDEGEMFFGITPDKYFVDKIYKKDDKFYLQRYTIYALRTGSEIKKDGKSKVVETTLHTNNWQDKLSVPMFKTVFDSFSSIERTELQSRAVFIETYVSEIVHLKWYETERFLKLLEIVLTVYQIAAIIGSVGTATEATEVLKQLAIEAVKAYLIKELIEFVAKEISPELAMALATMYAVYDITGGSFKVENLGSMKNTLQLTNSLSRSYQQIKNIELQEIKDKYDLHKEKYEEDMQFIERELEELNIPILDISDEDYNKIEQPQEYYQRTLYLKNSINIDIENYYHAKLDIF